MLDHKGSEEAGRFSHIDGRRGDTHENLISSLQLEDAALVAAIQVRDSVARTTFRRYASHDHCHFCVRLQMHIVNQRFIVRGLKVNLAINIVAASQGNCQTAIVVHHPATDMCLVQIVVIIPHNDWKAPMNHYSSHKQLEQCVLNARILIRLQKFVSQPHWWLAMGTHPYKATTSKSEV